MKTIITGKNLEITEAIDSYITKRFDGIVKFLDDSALVEVEILRTTYHHKSGEIFRAEVNIMNKGDHTRAAAEEEDLYKAIDKLRDETVHILSSKKGKRQNLWKRGKLQLKKMLRMDSAVGVEE